MKIINEMNMIRENVNIIKQFAEIPKFADLKNQMKQSIFIVDANVSDYEETVNQIVKESRYYKSMEEVLPSFAKEFDALFIMVLKDFDLGPLEFMLSTMESIASGNISKDKGEMAIGEHLAEQFIKIKK
jgi:hypothetical protein